MVDLFEEVEGELRNEQYKKLAIKLAPWIIGGLSAGMIVAAGAFAYIHYQDNTAAKAAGAYSSALDTLRKGDQEGAYKALDGVSGGAKAYKALALMVQAGIRLEGGKTDEAVKLFDKAADTAPSGKSGLILADTARLKAAWAVLDDSPYAEVEKRLKPLTEDGRPLRALARESLTIAMLNAGMIKEARAEATRLTVSPDASQGIAQRARLIISLIDSGSAAQIPAVTKAAKTAVPPAAQQMQITPEMIQQLRAQAAAQGGAAGVAPSGGDGQ